MTLIVHQSNAVLKRPYLFLPSGQVKWLKLCELSNAQPRFKVGYTRSYFVRWVGWFPGHRFKSRPRLKSKLDECLGKTIKIHPLLLVSTSITNLLIDVPLALSIQMPSAMNGNRTVQSASPDVGSAPGQITLGGGQSSGAQTEAMKQVLGVVDKKVRNMEKKKASLLLFLGNETCDEVEKCLCLLIPPFF